MRLFGVWETLISKYFENFNPLISSGDMMKKVTKSDIERRGI